MECALGEHLVEAVGDAGINDAVEFVLDLGLVAIADGLDKQVTQRPLLEGVGVAEHVEQVAVVGDRHLVDLRQQPGEHVSLAGVAGDHVPQVADLALADAVDAAEALLDAVRVPGQVVVHHQVRTLKVQAFASGVRGEQDHGVGVVGEAFTGELAIFAAGAAVDGDDRIGTPELGCDFGLQVIEGVAVLGEDDDLASIT